MQGLGALSVNFSELKPAVYSYLGFHGVGESEQTDAMISSCLEELENIAQFNYIYKTFDAVPEFLSVPPYAEFLSGCRGVMLSVMTLGAGADMRINRLARSDMARSVVLDSCASAYLEARSDEFEASLGEVLTPRFCPGYGGSSVGDIRYIFDLLHPERIGVTLNESCFMLPSKSMAGVIGIGKTAEKSCGGCILLEHCKYRKDGLRCYIPKE